MHLLSSGKLSSLPAQEESVNIFAKKTVTTFISFFLPNSIEAGEGEVFRDFTFNT